MWIAEIRSTRIPALFRYCTTETSNRPSSFAPSFCTTRTNRVGSLLRVLVRDRVLAVAGLGVVLTAASHRQGQEPANRHPSQHRHAGTIGSCAPGDKVQ